MGKKKSQKKNKSRNSSGSKEKHVENSCPHDRDDNPNNVIPGIKIKNQENHRKKPEESRGVNLYPTNGLSVKGLTNLGNTCFFNAVIQNLSHCQLFCVAVESISKTFEHSILPSDEEKWDRITVNVTDEPGPLTTALVKFIDEMRSDGKKAVINPSYLFTEICKKAPRFKGFRQQDSQELLRYLFDSIRSEEIKNVKRAILRWFGVKSCENEEGMTSNQVNEEIHEKIKLYGRKAKAPVIDSLFSGQLISSVECRSCLKVSTTVESFLDLSLSLIIHNNNASFSPVRGKNDRTRKKAPSPPTSYAQNSPIALVSPSTSKSSVASTERSSKTECIKQKNDKNKSARPMSKHQQKKQMKEKKKHKKKERRRLSSTSGGSKPSEGDDVTADDIDDVTEKDMDDVTKVDIGDVKECVDDIAEVGIGDVSELDVKDVMEDSVDDLKKANIGDVIENVVNVTEVDIGDVSELDVNDIMEVSVENVKGVNNDDLKKCNDEGDGKDEINNLSERYVNNVKTTWFKSDKKVIYNINDRGYNKERLEEDIDCVIRKDINDVNNLNVQHVRREETHSLIGVAANDVRASNFCRHDDGEDILDKSSDIKVQGELGKSPRISTENFISEVSNAKCNVPFHYNSPKIKTATKDEVDTWSETRKYTGKFVEDIFKECLQEQSSLTTKDKIMWSLGDSLTFTDERCEDDCHSEITCASDHYASNEEEIVNSFSDDDSIDEAEPDMDQQNLLLSVEYKRSVRKYVDTLIDCTLQDCLSSFRSRKCGINNGSFPSVTKEAVGRYVDNIIENVIQDSFRYSQLSILDEKPIEWREDFRNEASKAENAVSRSETQGILSENTGASKIIGNNQSTSVENTEVVHKFDSNKPTLVENMGAGDKLENNKSTLVSEIFQGNHCLGNMDNIPCNVMSVESCLKRFCTPELLDGKNLFLCEPCNEARKEKSQKNDDEDSIEDKGETNCKKRKPIYSEAVKQMLIKQAPPILTLHLKRFHQVGYSLKKVSKHVAFPLVLDISPFCHKAGKFSTDSEGKVSYALSGIVEHSGNLHGGHYTAYCHIKKKMSPILQWKFENLTELLKAMVETWTENGKNELNANEDLLTSRWFHISDSSVSEVSIDKVMKAQAYLLFYEKII